MDALPAISALEGNQWPHAKDPFNCVAVVRDTRRQVKQMAVNLFLWSPQIFQVSLYPTCCSRHHSKTPQSPEQKPQDS